MKLTPEKLTAFCAVLAETCNVGRACAAIDISRTTAYEWRDEIPDFKERWDKALKVGVTALEDEAHRRAFEGVDEPLTHQGAISYQTQEVEDDNGEKHYELVKDSNGKPVPVTVKKYSDTLAIFLLKAHAPDKYRERSNVELTGADGGPVQLSHTERMAKVASMVAKAKARQDEAKARQDEDDADDLV